MGLYAGAFSIRIGLWAYKPFLAVYVSQGSTSARVQVDMSA